MMLAGAEVKITSKETEIVISFPVTNYTWRANIAYHFMPNYQMLLRYAVIWSSCVIPS